MNALEIAGLVVYSAASLFSWRHLAYRHAKKEARGNTISGDDIGEGIFIGFLQTLVWPLFLLGWYFKHEPMLFRAYRDGKNRSDRT